MKSANVGLEARSDDPAVALSQVVAVLRSARRVLCVMHAGPDGDACGSTLGLALALAEQGRDVTLFCATEVPESFRFLHGLERLVHALPAEMRWDATVVCDASAAHRIGPGLPERSRLGTFINLDHHLTNDDFGDLNCVDAHAASVGVIVARLLRSMDHPLSAAVASALYVSVLTDTGSFRYSSTNPEALQVASELVAAGADPWTISSQIYEQQPLARMHLLGEALRSLRVSPDGLFASLVVTERMAAAAAADKRLTDGFINFARSVRGVEVAAQLTEPTTGTSEPWAVSLRSRGHVNVAAVASQFGGGGHHNAAGAKLAGSLDDVLEKLEQAVRRTLAGAAS
jgi:phosphoesterase RecJ-like protein